MKADIEALKRIAEAATAGPWVVWSSLYEGMAAAVVHDVEPLETVAEFRAYRNAVFLAAFDPPTCLALLSELASLRSEREGMREGNSSVGSPAEAGTPSPSGGPVLRHVEAVGAEWPDLGVLWPPFADNGVATKLLRAAEDYLDEYVLSTDGDDIEPTENERYMMLDFVNGLFSDETFWPLLQHLIFRALGPPTRCEQPLPPELAARILDVNLSGEPSTWDGLGAAAIRHAWASVRPLLAAVIALGTAPEDVTQPSPPSDGEGEAVSTAKPTEPNARALLHQGETP